MSEGGRQLTTCIQLAKYNCHIITYQVLNKYLVP